MKAVRPAHTGPGARPITPVLTVARDEAALARHGYIGLEHLLLALAHPTAPTTHHLLANHGISQHRARAAVQQVVGSGRGDGPRLDAAALLATLGIDLDQIRRQVEHRFGSDAIHRLYTGEVGRHLRPRGPLCDPPIAPNLKQAISDALGTCWGNAPPALHHRLLVAALDSDSAGLSAVLRELDAPRGQLRNAAAARIVKAAS